MDENGTLLFGWTATVGTSSVPPAQWRQVRRTVGIDGWRQVDDTEGADPELVQRTVPQSKVAETYYATCAAIDKHNQWKKIETKEWTKRVSFQYLPRESSTRGSSTTAASNPTAPLR